MPNVISIKMDEAGIFGWQRMLHNISNMYVDK